MSARELGAKLRRGAHATLCAPAVLREELPAHLQTLLDALADPGRTAQLSAFEWDRLVRSARSARLLGTLAVRVQVVTPPMAIPGVVRRHFDSALNEARFRRQKVRFLLATIAPLITETTPISVLLKGAAYVAQDLPIAQGRLPADVDLMVPRDRLDAVEAGLRVAGWQYEKTDSYDQRYYREWSHELPPMQCAGQALELDLHHGILPPLGRLRPDPKLLLAAAVPIDGSPYWALSPVDQVLHVAVHLFQDSDCLNRLRDLFDFDGLIRQLVSAQGVADVVSSVTDRAEQLGLVRPLCYSAGFAAAWCDTPGADEILASASSRPRHRLSTLVCTAAATTLGPPDPDQRPSAARRWSARLLNLRAAWLRMPPLLLAYHASAKALRRLRVLLDRKPTT